MCADQIKTVPIGSRDDFIQHLRDSSYDVAVNRPGFVGGSNS
jgi:hypothetical protein